MASTRLLAYHALVLHVPHRYSSCRFGHRPHHHCITLVLVTAAACQPSGAPPRQLVVLAGRFIDGSGAPARTDVRIVVQDGTITAVQPSTDDFLAASPDASLLDARKLTVMPGVVNAWSAAPPARNPNNNDALLLDGRAVTAELHALLRAGVTTIAYVGGPTRKMLAIREYTGTARHRGPRVLVSGPLATHGVAANLAESGATLGIENSLDARKFAQDQAITGVDFIAATPNFALVGCLPGFPGVCEPSDARPDDDWLCSLIDEAHRQEARVAVGTPNASARTHALQCAADVITGALPAVEVPVGEAHAQPQATLQLFLKSVAANEPGYADGGGLGFDGAGFVSTAGPLAALVRAGATPRQAIVAATHGSAQTLNLGDAIGLLAPGYRADFIAVDGDPEASLAALTRVRLVVLDGVVQDLDAPPGLGARFLLHLHTLAAAFAR